MLVGQEKNAIAFLRNECTDHKGRRLEEYWLYDDFKLENLHDYIQWMFPLDSYSNHCISAPRLTEEDIISLRKDTVARKNLAKSYAQIVQFYGFIPDVVDTPELVVLTPSGDFKNKFDKWGYVGNHNYLRLTRILRCMYLANMDECSKALLNALEKVFRENPDRITDDTLRYWRAYNDSN